MFSLIVTIVAIALVAALAIATIYYGGTVAQLAAASSNASTLANQGAQIYAASLLYEQNMGSWPASTDDLVTNNYLRTVPVPPSSSYALNDSALVTDALADNAAPAATDWTWVTNSSRNIWVRGKINEPTCHAVNQKFGLGFDIGQGINSNLAIQCFGGASPYTFVFIAPVGANGKTICTDISESTDSVVHAIPCAAGPSTGSPPPDAPFVPAAPTCEDTGTCPPAAPVGFLSINGNAFGSYEGTIFDIQSNWDTTTLCVVDPRARTNQTITSVQFAGGAANSSPTPDPFGNTNCVVIPIPTWESLGGPHPGLTSVGVTATVLDNRSGSPLGTYTATGTVTYQLDSTVDYSQGCNLVAMSPLSGPVAGGPPPIIGSGDSMLAGATVAFGMTLTPYDGTNTMSPGAIEYATSVSVSSTSAMSFNAPRALPALVPVLATTGNTDAPWATLPNIVDTTSSTWTAVQLAQVSCTNPNGMSGYFYSSGGAVPLTYQYPMPFIGQVGDGGSGGAFTSDIVLYGTGFVPGHQSVYIGGALATISYTSPDGSQLNVVPPSGAATGDTIRVRVNGSNDSNGVAMPALVTPPTPGTISAVGTCWGAGCDAFMTATLTVDGSNGYAADNVSFAGALSLPVANYTDTNTVEVNAPSLAQLAALGYPTGSGGALDVPVSIRSGSMVLATGTLHYQPSPHVASYSWEQLNQDEYRLTATGTNLTGARLAVTNVPTPDLSGGWCMGPGGPAASKPETWTGSSGVMYAQGLRSEVSPYPWKYALSEESATATSYSGILNMRLTGCSNLGGGSIRQEQGFGWLYGQTYGMALQVPGADASGGQSNTLDLVDAYITPPPLPPEISYTHPPIVDTPPAGGSGTQILIGFGSDSVPSGGLPMGAAAPEACLGSADLNAQNLCMAGVASALMGGTCSVQMESGPGLGYSQTNIEVMYCNGVSQAGWTAARGSVESWYLTLYHTSTYP